MTWNERVERALEGKVRVEWDMRPRDQIMGYEGLKPSDLKKLIEEGLADPNERHDLGPRLKELAELPDDCVSLGGVVVFQPRPDYRISVDTVIVCDITEIDPDLINEWLSSADEIEYTPPYQFRFWWD